MTKDFRSALSPTTSSSVTRKTEAIAAEVALDGIYIVRPFLHAGALDNAGTVAAYKSLIMVEASSARRRVSICRSDRSTTGSALAICAHVFLCMLSYHVEWNLRARLMPMLYDDDDRDAAAAERISIVAKAARSPAAQAKQTLVLTDDGLAVHCFHSFIAEPRQADPQRGRLCRRPRKRPHHIRQAHGNPAVSLLICSSSTRPVLCKPTSHLPDFQPDQSHASTQKEVPIRLHRAADTVRQRERPRHLWGGARSVGASRGNRAGTLGCPPVPLLPSRQPQQAASGEA